MARTKNKILDILAAIIELDLLANRYFDKHSPPPSLEEWLYPKARRNVYYQIKKGLLNPNLTFKQKPKSILQIIRKPWNGEWCFVLFDIPEEESQIRNSLRKQVYSLGFRQFQRSVWFSPLPAHNWLKKIQQEFDDSNVFTIVIGKIPQINPKEIIAEKWLTKNWQKQAEEWFKQIKQEGLRKKGEEEFWNLILEHPKVPLELLPFNWPLEKLLKTFTQLKFPSRFRKTS